MVGNSSRPLASSVICHLPHHPNEKPNGPRRQHHSGPSEARRRVGHRTARSKLKADSPRNSLDVAKGSIAGEADQDGTEKAVSRQNFVRAQNQSLSEPRRRNHEVRFLAMVVLLRYVFGWLVGVFRSRADLILENLALRQPRLASPRQTTSPPTHRVARTVLGSVAQVLGAWRKRLILVTPRTVVGWHSAGFRLYWKWLSRARNAGRRKISKQIRMVAENPTWGAHAFTVNC